MARRVQAFQLDGLANLDDISSLHAAVHAGNFPGSFVMRDDLGTGCRHHRGVATGVVMVLMRVEDLGDLPAFSLGCSQAFLVVQRVYSQRLARVGAGNQVVEVAVGVARPDSFNKHYWLQKDMCKLRL